jgi:multiple sugar transport system permease protein
MLRQFFLTLPRELEEAACIDGCGLWKIFCVVILPLSKPALATLGIFTFMGNWNSFIWPLIITNSETLKTLPVGLASFNGQYSTDWSLLMAACVMMIAPLIAVFIFGQRFFVKGIQMGAIKG